MKLQLHLMYIVYTANCAQAQRCCCEIGSVGTIELYGTLKCDWFSNLLNTTPKHYVSNMRYMKQRVKMFAVCAVSEI